MLREREKWEAVARLVQNSDRAREREARDREQERRPRESDSEGTSSAANVRRRPRPEAALIKLKGENGMEEVLRRVRKVDITGVSTRIEGITKTRTGDILLRVERGVGKAVPVLNTIKAAITDREVMLLEENCKLAVRDLDAVTTKEEVLEPILRVEPKARCRMKTMVATERGQMVAYVFVDRATADAITRTGFLRVGLTSCRVRVLVEQARCVRCWEVGHIVAKCTGADRRRMCFMCGKAGHQARECAGENECFVCEGVEPGTGKGHRAYTTGCPHDKGRVGVAPNPVVKEVTLAREGSLNNSRVALDMAGKVASEVGAEVLVLSEVGPDTRGMRVFRDVTGAAGIMATGGVIVDKVGQGLEAKGL
ncbi:uncharacterized protein LOC116181789 [Photinus pyralis]|uniref:uncharacterized protein LOC116181789 n=1 Tax=Photinus pyralis TaxID=7054 RepID=UPI0012675F3C|nr:uncharacterized protein LOC116181789 [Photinus pyralis]